MKDKSNLIFIHKLIKAFADSMLIVFVPLLILKNTSDMALVVLYYGVNFVSVLLLNIVLKRFLQKYGVIAMILHIIPIIAMQFILTVPNMTWWIVMIIALCAGLYQTLYSVPLNLLFTFSDKSANVAKFQIATNVGKLIFIILSGLFIGSSFTNSVLILAIVGGVLYILSIIPILYGYKMLKGAYNEIVKTPPVVDKKSYRIFNIFHVVFSIYQVVFDHALPIYLYINNLTFESVAIIMALIEFCKILANLLAGLLKKRGHALISIIISTVVFVISTIVIMIVKIPVVLYICSCAIAVSFPLAFVPAFNTYCKKLNKDGYQFDGMSYRDIFIFLPRPFIFLPYLLIPNMIVQFILGILCSTAMTVTASRFLKKDKNSDDKQLDKNSEMQLENINQIEKINKNRGI